MKHKESSYTLMKHVSPATTIVLNNTGFTFVTIFTNPSFIWASPNFNNKHNLASWILRVG